MGDCGLSLGACDEAAEAHWLKDSWLGSTVTGVWHAFWTDVAVVCWGWCWLTFLGTCLPSGCASSIGNCLGCAVRRHCCEDLRRWSVGGWLSWGLGLGAGPTAGRHGGGEWFTWSVWGARGREPWWEIAFSCWGPVMRQLGPIGWRIRGLEARSQAFGTPCGPVQQPHDETVR